MPLVFVHGVANRPGPEYDRALIARTELLRCVGLSPILTAPDKFTISNPLWGDLGANPRWGLASLPVAGRQERFGLRLTPPELILAEMLPPTTDNRNRILLDATLQEHNILVDLIVATAAHEMDPSSEFATEAGVLNRYANEDPWNWLSSVNNDEQLIIRFKQEASRWRNVVHGQDRERFGAGGLLDRIIEAGDRLVEAAPRFASSVILDKVRPMLTKFSVEFIGDALVYVASRKKNDQPGPIPLRIISALKDAWNAKTSDDNRFIIVAHSMGGNIMIDILTAFESSLPEGFKIDLLLTVGTQIGLLEEIKVFLQENDGIPSEKDKKVSKPQQVVNWLNVFDLADPVGFAVEPIFDGVKDFYFDTGAHVFAAHSTYFLRPSFHRRLADRVKGLFP